MIFVIYLVQTKGRNKSDLMVSNQNSLRRPLRKNLFQEISMIKGAIEIAKRTILALIEQGSSQSAFNQKNGTAKPRDTDICDGKSFRARARRPPDKWKDRFECIRKF